jgi:dTDP-4-dehydrorhamnose reductase
MTRWFVTGAGGMLGQDLCAALDAAGLPFHRVTERRPRYP